MKKQVKTTAILATFVIFSTGTAAWAGISQAANDQKIRLKNMCSENATAQSEPQEQKYPYSRLYGHEKTRQMNASMNYHF